MIVQRTRSQRGSRIAAVVSCSAVLFGGAGPAAGADVEIIANTTSVNLDTYIGSTVHVATGVTVGPPSLPNGPAINATLQAWSLTNDGSLFGDNAVNFTAGGTVNNNLAGTISSATSSAIVLGDFFLGGVGTVNNAGSISGSPFADAVELFGGGTVTNLATGTITAANGNNAVSISGGTSRSVINSGLISSPGGSFATGILLQGSGATNSVTNNSSGRIFGGYNGIYASSDVVLTLDNFGTISSTSGPTVEAVGGGTLTNRGTITNSGPGTAGNLNGISVGDSADAEIINSGTISGATNAINLAEFDGGSSGGTHTVRLQTGSVLNGNVVGGSGIDNLVLEGTGTETISKFLNFETLSMQGSDWSLNGAGTFSTGTTIQSGILYVNGQLTSPTVTVAPGGTLSGTGTIVGAVSVGGNLAPGNSIGTLSVQGSLVFTTAATYMIEVSGASADRTNVMGTASLAGNVAVTPLSRLSATTTYTILTSSGTTGVFAAVTVSNPGFARNARLNYVGNSVLLTLDPGMLSPSLPGFANINQSNVAGGIDNALLAGANPSPAFNTLLNLTGANLLNALTQASGKLPTASQQTTFDAMNLFLGLLTDPFMAGRGIAAASSAGATPYADDDSAAAYAATSKAGNSGRDAYAALFRKAPLATTYDPRWSVWAAGFGGSQSSDGNPALGSNAATSRVFGMAAGADYRFSPNTLAGFAMAGGGSNFSLANGLGTGRSDLFQAGAFVRHAVGAAYVSGALAYGWQDVTTDRTVTIAGVDRLHAEFNANAFSGRAEAGYRYVVPWIGGVGITPYVAGQFTTFDLPAYAESVLSGANTFALAYAAKSVTDSRSELGLRTDKSYAVNAGILTLRGCFAWAHDYNPDRTIGATFQTLPGASFVVNGAAQAHDAALTTASAEMKWTNGWSAVATFEGEFSDVTRSYAGKGVVRYAW